MHRQGRGWHYRAGATGTAGTAMAVLVIKEEIKRGRKKRRKKKRFAESNLATKRLEWPGDEPNVARIYMHLGFIVAAGPTQS